MAKEIFFGDKETFAVRYVPGYRVARKDTINIPEPPGYKHEVGYYYNAYLHLVLEGQIIGNPDEWCFADAWIYYTESTLIRLESHFDELYHPEFDHCTDEEVFQLIQKSNQYEDDFDPNYYYLPQLDNSIWSNCHISLDETIDAWSIYKIQPQKDKLKFLWNGWRQPCPPENINKTFSITVDRDFVIQTLNTCVEEVPKYFSKYPIHDWRVSEEPKLYGEDDNF